MKLESRSADAFGQVDLVVSNAGIPIVASLNHDTGGSGMGKRVAGLLVEALPAAGVIMLAFAAGLLAAAIGARAEDEPVRPQPTAEQVRTDCHCIQPTAEQFVPPNQPDVNPSDARAVDELFHVLIGSQPANSLDPPSSTPASGSVKR